MQVASSNYAADMMKNAQGASRQNSLEILKDGIAGGKEADIDRTAKDFEAVFITQMLQHMWGDVGKDGMFYGGNGEETWRGMLMDQYGKVIANNGGIGIAQSVKAEMLRMQEMSHGE